MEWILPILIKPQCNAAWISRSVVEILRQTSLASDLGCCFSASPSPPGGWWRKWWLQPWVASRMVDNRRRSPGTKGRKGKVSEGLPTCQPDKDTNTNRYKCKCKHTHMYKHNRQRAKSSSKDTYSKKIQCIMGGISLDQCLYFQNSLKCIIQGVFFHWASPKKLKYGKPRLGESTLT